MQSKLTIIALIIAICAYSISCLPSQFDIRTIGQNSLVTDYKIRLQGICLGQTWAQQIAQAVSNMESIAQGIRINLSAQQLLECTDSIVNKCHQVNLDIIHNALSYVQNKGLTFQFCYPNDILQLPSQICKYKCKNGADFPIHVKTNIEKIPLENRNQMLKKLSNGNTVILAVFMVDDGMNFVYPGKFQAGNQAQDQQIYGVGIGQVVGWKKNGDVLNIRIGLGSQWGYGGYAYVNVVNHPSVMLQYYALSSKFNKKSNETDFQLKQA